MMQRKFYRFWQNMSINDQWVLGESFTKDGTQIEGWHFTMGIPYLGPLPSYCNPLQEGREMPVSFGGLDALYLQKPIADTIRKITPTAVQTFPISVKGTKNIYEIVNVIVSLNAIHKSSLIEHYSEADIKEEPDRLMRFKMVWKLALNQNEIPLDSHIFRLQKNLIKVIVSEDIKLAIEAVCPNHGAKFELIESA
jgi:hypothetical protein